ncbi:hypothetical protein BV22DRAFT_1052336 [Leucogyrophana mollusca]|uniref:Uncharacterized protein n=1 Tax=Leucogyrophana mollusca TaxID=85980 RepID=A0ACB8AVL3_9AGAM|nr:hypothetical protein BV22DRAFT_1052336 [Leucogyrophana mollusca]
MVRLSVVFASTDILSRQRAKRWMIRRECDAICRERYQEIVLACSSPPNTVVISGSLHESDPNAKSTGGDRLHCTLRFEVRRKGVVRPVGSGHLYYDEPAPGHGVVIGREYAAVRVKSMATYLLMTNASKPPGVALAHLGPHPNRMASIPIRHLSGLLEKDTSIYWSDSSKDSAGSTFGSVNVAMDYYVTACVLTNPQRASPRLASALAPAMLPPRHDPNVYAVALVTRPRTRRCSTTTTMSGITSEAPRRPPIGPCSSGKGASSCTTHPSTTELCTPNTNE